MKRAWIWILALLLLAAAGALVVARSRRATTLRSRPLDVLLICLDAVRADTFAAADAGGLDDPLTPWLDRALRFEHAQSAAPWTLPSVSSVMTSLDPARHGAGRFSSGIGALETTIPPVLSDSPRTLAEELAAHGFETATFHSNRFAGGNFGVARGFATKWFGGTDGQLVERTRAFLRQRPETAPPSFVYLHLLSAHNRHARLAERLPAPFARLPTRIAAAARERAPAGVCDPADARRRQLCRRFQIYFHAIRQQRAVIAELLEELRALGRLERTVVVVFADHGEEFDDHGAEERARGLQHDGAYGFGHGHTLYQELLHVPLLVWHPQLAGRRVGATASLLDIAPSLVDWAARAQPPAEWEGVPLRRLLDAAPAERPLFASAIGYGPGQHAVLLGSRKLILLADGTQQLFDLATDPTEKRPRTEGDAALLALLATRQKLTPIAPSGAPVLSQEEVESLKALGYLGGAGAGTGPVPPSAP